MTGVGVVRVLVVDDHQMMAQALAAALSDQPGIDVVAIAGTASDGTRLAAQTTPDVVVMDYRLPDGDGVEATARIRRASPTTAVVMVTASSHETVISSAIEAGCVGFVTKDRAIQDVVAAVHAAARGDVAFPASALLGLQAASRGAARSRVLTPRELEVLRLLAGGASTEDVADGLFVSVSTVRNHVHSILTKLGVHSKLEAVVTAVREGIIDLPG